MVIDAGKKLLAKWVGWVELVLLRWAPAAGHRGAMSLVL
jgi:hypothetical protein